MQSLVWRASRPKPGQIHVTSSDLAGLSGRPILYVTGQEDGRSRHSENGLLPDAQRRQLHPSLALQADRLAESSFHAAERLSCLDGKVTFSYSQRCRETDQEQFPPTAHPFLEVTSGDLGQPETVDQVLQRFPDLARGCEAERQRQSPIFTAYDGLVPAAAHRWDPRQQEKPTSVSRLQSLAACPFQFFLAHGLGVYPHPLPEPDRNLWLDPMERGHVLHELFASWVSQGKDPELQLDESLSRLPPAPAPWLEARERKRLLTDFRHFLSLESARADRQALGCEVPFDQLSIDLGDGLQFLLRGCIDRVDRTAAGLSVVDYKTGRTFRLPDSGSFFHGRHLQHALYALAAESLFQEPVGESGYYPTHPVAAKSWHSFAPPDRETLRQVLELVFRPTLDGTFVQSHQSETDCRYCHYRAACVGHQEHLVKSKLDSPLLQARRSLLETM